jgi:hypothetical protein
MFVNVAFVVDRAALVCDADLVLCVQPPAPEDEKVAGRVVLEFAAVKNGLSEAAARREPVPARRILRRRPTVAPQTAATYRHYWIKKVT